MNLNSLLGILPLVIIITLLLLVFIRPGIVKSKKLKAMRFALKVGDRVTTEGGAKGRICKITGDDINVIMDASNIETVFARDSIVDAEPQQTRINGFCSKCSTATIEESTFCHKCGASVSNTYVANTAQYVSTQDEKSFGFAVLGFFIPLVGLILYCVWKENTPLRASSAGKGAIVGAIVSVILGIVSFLLQMHMF